MRFLKANLILGDLAGQVAAFIGIAVLAVHFYRLYKIYGRQTSWLNMVLGVIVYAAGLLMDIAHETLKESKTIGRVENAVLAIGSLLIATGALPVARQLHTFTRVRPVKEPEAKHFIAVTPPSSSHPGVGAPARPTPVGPAPAVTATGTVRPIGTFAPVTPSPVPAPPKPPVAEPAGRGPAADQGVPIPPKQQAPPVGKSRISRKSGKRPPSSPPAQAASRVPERPGSETGAARARGPEARRDAPQRVRAASHGRTSTQGTSSADGGTPQRREQSGSPVREQPQPVQEPQEPATKTLAMQEAPVEPQMPVQQPPVMPQAFAIPETPARTEAESIATPPGETLAKRSYIIGNIVGANLTGRDGKIFADKGQVITEEMVSQAKQEGKLAELIIDMYIPDAFERMRATAIRDPLA